MTSGPWGKGKSTAQPSSRPVAEQHERHRFGGIVHDERGNGILLWAPIDSSSGGTAGGRVPLSLVDDTRRGERRRPKDLRKLGEWIKLQRAMAEKRARGDVDEDDE